MAKIANAGDRPRNGAVRQRSQVRNPVNGNRAKRDTESRFIGQKQGGAPFEGVRRDKK